MQRDNVTKISIHALREEGDAQTCTRAPLWGYFYPRPPRGGRQLRIIGDGAGHLFLSTPSARRATMYSARAPRTSRHFYPRPPRGGRPVPSSETTSVEDFYPRPPRGGRLAVGPVHIEPFEFLSTPSARRATRSRAQGGQLEENFYPRPPRGGRHADLENPTQAPMISIHALREEGDRQRRKEAEL